MRQAQETNAKYHGTILHGKMPFQKLQETQVDTNSVYLDPSRQNFTTRRKQAIIPHSQE